MNRFLAFEIALFVSVLGHAQEVNRLSVSHLALYQPDDVVRSRTGDFTEFTKYVKGVNVSVEEVLEKLEVANARTGAIVVVVRPNGRMRLWFAESSGELSSEQERVISDAIAKVPVCLVHNGPVAFAVAYSMGGKVPSDTAIPIPEEWRNAMPKDKAVYIPDEIMTKIWPDNGES